MTAEWPSGATMPPASAPSPGRLRWFENLAGSEPFDDDGEHVALDFSLQMAIALRNCRARATSESRCFIKGELGSP
jgi:hypothetical protein